MLCAVIVGIGKTATMVATENIESRKVGLILAQAPEMIASVIGFVGIVFDHADGITQTLIIIVIVLCVSDVI